MKMGIEPIYPKPRLSQKQGGAQIYPYMVSNAKIKQVFGARTSPMFV
jgi:hypothetical protein